MKGNNSGIYRRRPPIIKRRKLAYTLPGAQPTLEQYSFRFRNDDGSEATATWLAATNTNASQNVSVNARLRVLINSTGDPATSQFQLEYRAVGGPAWIKVV